MGLGHLLQPRPLRPVPPALSPAAQFEQDLAPAERHALGAHFTSEPDILKVVGPTIERPWQQRIAAAATPAELAALHAELTNFHVLDPACGCGNFLLVAYRVLLELEQRLLARIAALAPSHPSDNSPHATASEPTSSLRTPATAPITLPPGSGSEPARPTAIRLAQLHGIDINPGAAALARKLLRLARPAGSRDASEPDIVVADALFAPWPEVSAIVGNPPFLDARKLPRERPDLDIAALRRAYPRVPGRADLCVYFFHRAHDHLREGHRAGLVGTNTIRQNYSREGSLDHILADGGTITDAVATQVWSGDAAVHVSIVNWLKGPHAGPCTLSRQLGDAADAPCRTEVVPRISSSLTTTDVSTARPLAVNRRPFCFEGIQPGHRGFRLTAAELHHLLRDDPRLAEVVAPYLNGDDLLSGAAPEYLVDLAACPIDQVTKQHPALLAHLERTVLPDWRRNAAAERARTGKPSGEHQNRLQRWWQLKRPRPELQKTLRALPRYIACSRVTRRPIFAFLDAAIKPDSSLTVFAAADDYSFGVLQSSLHWTWFQARCSTLKGDCRYTSNTVFDSFAWPQSPSRSDARALADAAVALRATRARLLRDHAGDLRGLHKRHETAADSPLRAAQHALDAAVLAAYTISGNDDILTALLALNLDVARREAAGLPVTGPGLPPGLDVAAFITADRREIPRPPR